MVQTSVSQVPAKGLEGQIVEADNEPVINSVAVDEATGIKPGRVVVRSAGGDSAAKLPVAIPAADDNAIVLAHATVAADTTLSGAGLDGVIGAGRISPPAKLELVCTAHADFNDTIFVVIYEDQDGVRRRENLNVPDGGGVTIRTEGYASKVISLFQPAQGGIGGSFQLGTTTETALGKRDVLGLSVHTHKTLATPSSSDNEVYEDEDVMPVLRKRRAWVKVENAFSAGDVVFVRGTAGVGEEQGKVRVGDDDAGDCSLATWARLMTSGGAGDLGQLEVDL